MQVIRRIDDIETRAQAINLSLWWLCENSAAEYAVVRRWKAGKGNPTIRTFQKHVGALEAALGEAERAQLRYLAGALLPAKLAHHVTQALAFSLKHEELDRL